MNGINNAITIPNWILAIGTLIAIVVSLFAIGLTRREKKVDLFLSLWEEYRSTEMLEALQTVFNLWRDCGGDAEAVAMEYVRRVRDNNDTRLHDHRRKVSLLFQKLAVLYYHKAIPREFRKDWLSFSWDVIAVLRPIERDAMRKILRGEPLPPEKLSLEGVEPGGQRLMFSLYNELKKKKIPPVDRDELIRLLLIPLAGSTQYRYYMKKSV